MNRTPRWLFLAIGAFVGIALLSVLLRNAVTTGEETTLWTFAAVHFTGYLFLVISPVEIFYVHMLGAGHDLTTLFGLALGTALLAQTADYKIGLAFSDSVIEKVIGEENYVRNLHRIEAYGSWTIFFFCLFPLSSPIVILVAGMIRYPLLRVLLFSSTGLALKYSALALFF
ncbi:hypothetical protein [Haliea sp.]